MRGDRDHLASRALVAAMLVAACTRSGSPDRAPEQPARVVATISGAVDASTGTLTLEAFEAAPQPAGRSSGAGVARSALVDIPVVQDGVPGQGPDDTVELVTERAATAPAGCGAVDGFEGDIRLRSFFDGWELRNVYVEIISITPTGREACNSAPPVAGVSDEHGLFSYGTLAGKGASAVATWRFRLPDATRFTFTGRVMADVVDATPPVTTATPAGGAMPPTEVTLACADAGSGCAVTYYTVDGTEPTTASTPYTAPFAVTSSSTIRYFSVDAAGNAEAPQARDYVIDAVPPTVKAVSPRPRQGSVPESAVVEVDFSEPMDPATIPGALSVSGPSGPCAGSVTQLDAARWQFRPAAPLPPATTFHVEVGAGARDVAGNPLVPFGSTFATTTPATTVSGRGSATYRAWSLAHDASGNAVALFATSSWAAYRGGKLLYAYYDAATGTWGPEQALSITDGQGLQTMPAKIVSNGSSFLAVWQQTDGPIRSALITRAGAGPVVTLAPLGNLTYPPATFDVATNGAGYAAIFVDGAVVKVQTHDGTSWDPAGPTVVPSTTSEAINPVIAPRGSSWAVAYGGRYEALWTASYDAANRTWAATKLVAASTSAYVIGPAIASNATTVMVGWGTTTGPVMAAMDSGAGFGTPVAVSSGLGDRPAGVLAAAANGARFALAWLDRTSLPTTVGSAYGAIYDGTSWTGTSSLETRTGPVTWVALAAYGAGFAAALEISDSPAATVPTSIWLNPTTSGGWWSAANLVQAETSTAHAAHPVLATRGTQVVVGWDQDDGTRHQVRTRTFNGSFGATSGIVDPGQVAASTNVRLATNHAGEVAAVWTQDDRGGPAVFAALRSGGTWQPPVRVALAARAPAVASNGQDYLVAYEEAPPNGGTSTGVRAVRITGGVVGTSTVLEAGNMTAPSVASDGTGYLVTWRSGTTATRAAIDAGGAWSANTTLSTTSGVYQSAAVGRPGAYMVGWRDPTYAIVTRAATAPAPGGPWTWETAPTVIPGVAPTAEFALAATSATFGIAWSDPMSGRGGAYAAVHTGAWQPRVTLVTSPPYCDLARIAASADGFLAAVNCTSGVVAARYSGGAWSAPASVGAAATALAISSDGEGYKLLARQADGAGTSLYTIDVTADGMAWPRELVASGTVPAPSPIQTPLSGTFDGVEYVGAWIQQGDDVATDVVRARAAY